MKIGLAVALLFVVLGGVFLLAALLTTPMHSDMDQAEESFSQINTSRKPSAKANFLCNVGLTFVIFGITGITILKFLETYYG
ncbi:hypothetical protein [Ruegeria arenilitoris]|uniref:hypothetical protein n=1 Tax=Ruegeria arenilitoris TaxID=1173585 RepID=UPI00147F37C2|nr:hypothetical protein [Ruegeria arenilitoris]